MSPALTTKSKRLLLDHVRVLGLADAAQEKIGAALGKKFCAQNCLQTKATYEITRGQRELNPTLNAFERHFSQSIPLYIREPDLS